MSTRSQLRFVQRVEQPSETDGDDERIAQVYRHSDGYPASVLRDLAQLKELLDATRAERGPAYTAATFVFLDKLSTVGFYLDGDPERTIDAAQPADLLEPSNIEHLDQPLFLLGHGVENPADGIHGDEEYLYVVELPTTNAFDEPAEWTVKVSGHSAFPRWDGPTDEAFEQATWQFEGALTVALDDLLAEPV
ncbi:hypothetical protein [Halosegnis rubeus]|jgi:hypothetical protein|uniref:Uncharacterized protein n=1 Tax=Halosegnis rubeus TaxID=2212850 RepID=A0A5N5U3S8_9EURY|nr:hypothetical protein [Halosegnis rubeus]KAB7513220.1 hypothetical protein DMP03_12575 [Halosegnis rubeus]